MLYSFAIYRRDNHRGLQRVLFVFLHGHAFGLIGSSTIDEKTMYIDLKKVCHLIEITVPTNGIISRSKFSKKKPISSANEQ